MATSTVPKKSPKKPRPAPDPVAQVRRHLARLHKKDPHIRITHPDAFAVAWRDARDLGPEGAELAKQAVESWRTANARVELDADDLLEAINNFHAEWQSAPASTLAGSDLRQFIARAVDLGGDLQNKRNTAATWITSHQLRLLERERDRLVAVVVAAHDILNSGREESPPSARAYVYAPAHVLGYSTGWPNDNPTGPVMEWLQSVDHVDTALRAGCDVHLVERLNGLDPLVPVPDRPVTWAEYVELSRYVETLRREVGDIRRAARNAFAGDDAKLRCGPRTPASNGRWAAAVEGLEAAVQAIEAVVQQRERSRVSAQVSA